VTTCLSKAVALYASIEWGLRDIEFLSPHSFRCNHGTFRCCVVDHEDSTIFINWREDQREDEYDVYIIRNKEGDNAVLFRSIDLEPMSNKWVSFEWIAKHLKKKWRVDFPPSTSAT
jgi:hypothetical protein